jgi:hypothetical protein
MKRIHWLRAVLGAIAAEAAQITCAFAWVALYSHVLNPGRPMTHYEAHAQQSGPWVALIAGFLVFYAASRWIARSRATAMALFVIFAVFDGALTVMAVMSMRNVESLLVGLIAASYLTKSIACYFGGLSAERAIGAASSP